MFEQKHINSNAGDVRLTAPRQHDSAHITEIMLQLITLKLGCG